MQTNNTSEQVKPDEFKEGDTVWCLINYEYDCSSIDSHYLSQSELQMLQRIVAEKISNLERDVAFCKHDASVYGKGSEERDFLFKEAFKKQSKINKLSALQYRLKHKIAAKG